MKQAGNRRITPARPSGCRACAPSSRSSSCSSSPRPPPRRRTWRSAAPRTGSRTSRPRPSTALAYGYGYAFAQDNLCEMAETYVTVDARALALLRARRARYASRGNGSDAQQPQLGLLLPADQGRPGRSRSCSSSRRPPGPLPRDPRGRRAATSAGYNAYLREIGVERHARPALPRQGVGAADHRDRRLPALLPARAAGQLGRRDRRDRAAQPPTPAPAAAARRACRADGEPARHAATTGCRSATSAPTPSRSASAATERRQGPAARQPALPVGRAGALLPGAAHDPRQGSTSPARRCSACR